MTEGDLMRSVMLEVGGAPECRIFRNNTGLGWVGEVIKRTNELLILKNWRPLNAGLAPGSGDLIGWRSIVVTPEMVGKKIAVFTNIEVKTKTGKVSNEQQKFIDAINNAGGFAGVARSKEDGNKIIKK